MSALSRATSPRATFLLASNLSVSLRNADSLSSESSRLDCMGGRVSHLGWTAWEGERWEGQANVQNIFPNLFCQICNFVPQVSIAAWETSMIRVNVVTIQPITSTRIWDLNRSMMGHVDANQQKGQRVVLLALRHNIPHPQPQLHTQTHSLCSIPHPHPQPLLQSSRLTLASSMALMQLSTARFCP